MTCTSSFVLRATLGTLAAKNDDVIPGGVAAWRVAGDPGVWFERAFR